MSTAEPIGDTLAFVAKLGISRGSLRLDSVLDDGASLVAELSYGLQDAKLSLEHSTLGVLELLPDRTFFRPVDSSSITDDQVDNRMVLDALRSGLRPQLSWLTDSLQLADSVDPTIDKQLRAFRDLSNALTFITIPGVSVFNHTFSGPLGVFDFPPTRAHIELRTIALDTTDGHIGLQVTILGARGEGTLKIAPNVEIDDPAFEMNFDLVLSISPVGPGAVIQGFDFRVNSAGIRGARGRMLLPVAARQLHHLEGHSAPVSSVAINQDASLAVTVSTDQTIKVWDVATGQEVRTLAGHTGPVNSVNFSPDGQRLVSGSDDRTVRMWDVASGAEFSILTGHTDRVSSVVFSQDGQTIVSGSGDRTAKLWNATNGQELKTFTNHTAAINGVDLSSNGQRLVTGSDDHTIKIWDVSSATVLFTLEEHSAAVTSVAFSPDNTRVVSGSRDQRIGIWNATSGEFLQLLLGHSKAVTSVAITADGTRILSASQDRSAKIWDAGNGQLLAEIGGHTDTVTGAAISPDGTVLVIGSADRSATIWDAKSAEPFRLELASPSLLMQNVTGHIEDVAAPGGMVIDGGPVHVTAAQILVTRHAMDLGKDLRYVPDAPTQPLIHAHDVEANLWVRTDAPPDEAMVTSWSGDFRIPMMELRRGRLEGETVNGLGVHGRFRIPQASFGLQHADYRLQIHRLELSTLELLLGENFPPIAELSDQLAFTGIHIDGDIEYSSSLDADGQPQTRSHVEQLHILADEVAGRQRLVDVNTMLRLTGSDTFLNVLNNSIANLNQLRLTCQFALTPEENDAPQNRIFLIDYQSGGQFDGSSHGFALLIDGGQLKVALRQDVAAQPWVFLDANQTVRARRQYVVDLYFDGAHAEAITALATNGRRLVSGSSDDLARIWGNPSKFLEGHRDDITSVAITSDGKRIFTASKDKLIKIWDADSGSELLTVQANTDAVNAVAVTSDGGFMISGSADNRVLLMRPDGTQVQEFSHTQPVNDVAVSQTDATFVAASGSNDHTVQIYDAASLLHTITTHTAPVLCVDVSSDATRVVSGSADNTLRVFDSEHGTELLVLDKHTDRVLDVAFSHDGTMIASASADKTIRLWDAANGDELAVLTGHSEGVTSVAFYENDKQIVSGSADRTVRRWRVETGVELEVLTGKVVIHVNGTRRATHAHGQPIVQATGPFQIAGASPNTFLKGFLADVGVWSLAYPAGTIPDRSESGMELWLPLAGLTLDASPAERAVKVIGNEFAFEPWPVEYADEGAVDVTVIDSIEATSNPASNSVGRVTRAARARFGELHFAKPISRVIVGREYRWNDRAADRLLTIGALNAVGAVSIAADGSLIASGDNDGTVRVWSTADFREFLTLAEFVSPISGVGILPISKRIVAAAAAEQTLRVWDGTDGTLLRVLGGHSDVVHCVGMARGDDRIASGSSDQTIRIWSEIQLAETAVLGVAFSRDGSKIATAAADHAIKIWDAHTGVEQLHIDAHAKPVTSVVFSSDGTKLVSASADKTVKVWDASNGQQQLSIDAHSNTVHAASLSSDDAKIVTGSADQTVKIWNVSDGSLDRRISGHSDEVLSVNFSPDDSKIVSASMDQEIKIWDAANGSLLLTLTGHTGAVQQVSFSSDGNRIVSSSTDATIRVWDATNGSQLLMITGHVGAVTQAKFSEDRSRIVSGGTDQTVRVWNAANGNSSATYIGHQGAIHSLDIRNNGQRIVSADSTGLVRFWEQLTGHSGPVRTVAFSPDGSRLVSGSDDKTVKVWDLSSGTELLSISAHTESVRSVAMSADGSKIASGSDDKTVKIWDAALGTELLNIAAHAAPVTAVVMSPNNQLISGSEDSKIKFWDALNGTELLTINDHTKPVTSLGLTADGQQLVSGSKDKTVRVWDAATGDSVSVLLGMLHKLGHSLGGQRMSSEEELRDELARVMNARDFALYGELVAFYFPGTVTTVRDVMLEAGRLRFAGQSLPRSATRGYELAGEIHLDEAALRISRIDGMTAPGLESIRGVTPSSEEFFRIEDFQYKLPDGQWTIGMSGALLGFDSARIRFGNNDIEVQERSQLRANHWSDSSKGNGSAIQASIPKAKLEIPVENQENKIIDLEDFRLDVYHRGFADTFPTQLKTIEQRNLLRFSVFSSIPDFERPPQTLYIDVREGVVGLIRQLAAGLGKDIPEGAFRAVQAAVDTTTWARNVVMDLVGKLLGFGLDEAGFTVRTFATKSTIEPRYTDGTRLAFRVRGGIEKVGAYAKVHYKNLKMEKQKKTLEYKDARVHVNLKIGVIVIISYRLDPVTKGVEITNVEAFLEGLDGKLKEFAEHLQRVVLRSVLRFDAIKQFVIDEVNPQLQGVLPENIDISSARISYDENRKKLAVSVEGTQTEWNEF